MRQYFQIIILLILNLLLSQEVKASSPKLQIDEISGKTYLVIHDTDNSTFSNKVFINNIERSFEPYSEGVRYPISVDRAGEYYTISVGSNANKQRYHISKVSSGYRIKHIPGWYALIPPLLAILLALLLKEVNISLFIGIWSGAFILSGLRFDNMYYLAISLLESISKYVIHALEDSGHLSVIVFSLMIGGMVAIISKNGGMAGVVNKLAKYARGKRSTQLITWFLGIAIFFDDYANTLIVGNTMRPVTDRFKISREKLAYIVDSTAAPVSAIAFITTWIGAELGYIESSIVELQNFDSSISAYAIFVDSLKYSFYPILTLIFVVLLIYSGKEYGPMKKAEDRAKRTGRTSPAATIEEDEPNMEELSPVPGAPNIWWHAALPVLTVIAMTILGLTATGMERSYQLFVENGYNSISEDWVSIWNNMALLPNVEDRFFMKLGQLIGNADSYVALIWASLSGIIVAIIITIGNKIMSLFDSMHVMMTGFKTMLPALLILCLAWALADITALLNTADFITGLIGNRIDALWMPSIIFILSAVIAFSTGSSWSTMAILYPLAIPATWSLCLDQGLDIQHSMEILYSSIATVLAASVLGDHCSPISDTTILSSLSSDCNHIAHVRTQMPYALTVGSVSLICVFGTSIIGGGWVINMFIYALASAVLYLIIRILGK